MVVKPDKEEEVRKVFHNRAVQITCAGRKYLGGALGTDNFEKEFMAENMTQWKKKFNSLLNLPSLSHMQPTRHLPTVA